MSFVPLVKLWLWISVLATAAGWILSALGQLNSTGYVIFLGVAVLLLWIWREKWVEELGSIRLSWGKFRQRFKRPLPLAFLILSFLVALGGFLYPPSNHTALTYRIPRVLQWLTHEGWFWIHTSNYRMNDRACGIEWLSAPLLLFTKSDRALFLINFIPFLLLPGLVFSLFTRLGVWPRVASYWMWLLPTGYTFLLQAGSTGNDTFPTVYALAALEFACRGWKSARRSDLYHSLLAAALLTGAKASNLPLLLPWALIFVPLCIRKVSQFSWGGAQNNTLSSVVTRHWSLLLIFLLAALVSFLPTALLNSRYCGDWSGLALERAGMDMKNPLVGIWGNALLFLLDNLIPPFFPAAGWWNQNALAMLPGSIARPLVANFESSFHWVWELPTEDWVGIGFGLSWLLLAAVLAGLRIRSTPNISKPRSPVLPPVLRRLVLWAPWVALLAYSMKSGMATGARLISPYYPLLLPLLLAGWKQAQVVRSRWWRIGSWIVIALAFPVLALTPGRPLWPAESLLSRLHFAHPDQRLIARAANVYSIYATRSDPLAGVRSLLPPDTRILGFMARGDDPDISLWRPFGQRRVEHVLVSDSAAQMQARGIRYVVAGEHNFGFNGTTFAAWQQRVGGQLLATTNLTVRVSEMGQPWYVVKIAP